MAWRLPGRSWSTSTTRPTLAARPCSPRTTTSSPSWRRVCCRACETYRMDVLEEGDQVVFLRQVVPGGADRSYGIHVAQLAGIPRGIIRRAQEILDELEREHPGDGRIRRAAMRQPAPDRPRAPAHLLRPAQPRRWTPQGAGCGGDVAAGGNDDALRAEAPRLEDDTDDCVPPARARNPRSSSTRRYAGMESAPATDEQLTTSASPDSAPEARHRLSRFQSPIAGAWIRASRSYGRRRSCCACRLAGDGVRLPRHAMSSPATAGLTNLTESYGALERVALWQRALRLAPRRERRRHGFSSLRPAVIAWLVRIAFVGMFAAQAWAFWLAWRARSTRPGPGWSGPVLRHVVMILLVPSNADVFFYEMTGDLAASGINPYVYPLMDFPGQSAPGLQSLDRDDRRLRSGLDSRQRGDHGDDRAGSRSGDHCLQDRAGGRGPGAGRACLPVRRCADPDRRLAIAAGRAGGMAAEHDHRVHRPGAQRPVDAAALAPPASSWRSPEAPARSGAAWC